MVARAVRASSAAVASARRTVLRGSDRDEQVVGAGGSVRVLVACGGVERGAEAVAVLLARVEDTESVVGVLGLEAAVVERDVVWVAAGGGDVVRAVRAVDRGELAAVDDRDV